MTKLDQVFILTEGKSVQFTHAKAGVVSFQWAPDGRGLYFLAPDPERKEELKRRNERYGDFAYIDKDYVWNCVYYQELPSGAAGSILDSGPKDLRRQEDRARKLVGDDGLHVLNYAVSPDNGRLAFMAASTPDSEDREQAALYLMDMAQGEYRGLPVPKPLDGEVLFSLQGTRSVTAALLTKVNGSISPLWKYWTWPAAIPVSLSWAWTNALTLCAGPGKAWFLPCSRKPIGM